MPNEGKGWGGTWRCVSQFSLLSADINISFLLPTDCLFDRGIKWSQAPEQASAVQCIEVQCSARRMKPTAVSSEDWL